MDNWAASTIVRLRSMREDYHGVATRIAELCRRFNIVLEPFWILRDSVKINFCDELSKQVETSDYWLSDKDFGWLERRRGPFSTDYFASDRSWRLEPSLDVDNRGVLMPSL